MTGKGAPDQRQEWVAGVVVYEPEPAGLIALLGAALLETTDVVLFLNSPLPAAVEEFFAGELAVPVTKLGDGTNVGLGVAYNRLLAFAQAQGFRRIVLFDQDALPSAGMIGRLVDRMRALEDRDCRPAVVGPRLLAPDGSAFATPEPREGVCGSHGTDCVPLDFVISSGSLIDIAACREVGPFREDFFIDFVDVEWCLRANRAGYSCWMSLDTPMTHRLGSGVVCLPFFPLRIARQPPVRAYTFIRNQIAMLRLAHVSRDQKLRTAVRLIAHSLVAPLVNPSPWRVLEQIVLGWRHGLSGRLGPPPSR